MIQALRQAIFVFAVGEAIYRLQLRVRRLNFDSVMALGPIGISTRFQVKNLVSQCLLGLQAGSIMQIISSKQKA